MSKIIYFVKDLFKNKILKITLLLFLALILLLSGIRFVFSIKEKINDRYPIVSITATNDYIYNPDNPIRSRQFKVIAKRENGTTKQLSEKEYTLNRKYIINHGKETPVTITLKENKKISCICKIKHKRKHVIGWYCGTPNTKDLRADIYSNGELCFSGNGEMMEFNNYPWLEDDYDITAITFGKNVEITNLNNAFSGLTKLVYVDPIPKSVKYLNNTFSGCTSLETAAEWSQSQQIEDISYTYSECSALKKASALPVSVRVAEGTYMNCTSLIQTPNMEQPVNLNNVNYMYQGCTSLASVDTMPPNCTALLSMFESCINLKEAPQIPISAVNMSRTFYGCRSLKAAKTIPAGVKVLDEAFYGCEMLNGTLDIESSDLTYTDCFADAITTSRLDLIGSSSKLKKIAKTGNSNITVNGNPLKGNMDRTLLENSIPDASLQMNDTDTTQSTEDDTAVVSPTTETVTETIPEEQTTSEIQEKTETMVQSSKKDSKKSKKSKKKSKKAKKNKK